MENRKNEKENLKKEIKEYFRFDVKQNALRKSVSVLEKNRSRLTREEYIDLDQLITHLKITTK